MAPAGGFIKFSLNICAAWYFATYLQLPGALAVGPIILASMCALILQFARPEQFELRDVSYGVLTWSFTLAALASWQFLTAWYHDADYQYYETPTKMLAASLLAFVIGKRGINLNWIIAGTVLGSLWLALLVYEKHSGPGRFSPLMNATKWGNAVSYQVLLAVSLMIVSDRIVYRLLLGASASFCLYATVITGTRGAWLSLLIGGIFLIVFCMSKLKRRQILLLVVALIIMVSALSHIQPFDQRIDNMLGELSSFVEGNYLTSPGLRITMWEAGILGAMEGLVLGVGYDFEGTIMRSLAYLPSQDEAVRYIAANYQNFHNIYIDTLVRSGSVGLVLLLLLFRIGLKHHDTTKKILMTAPIVGIGVTGFTDSVLSLGITTDYFLIAAAVLLATEMPSKHRVGKPLLL